MAKDPNNPFVEEPPPGAEAPAGKATLLVRLGLMVVVLAIGLVGGYTMGGMFHSPATAQANPPAAQEEPFTEPLPAIDTTGEEFEYVDFEAIVVNLDVSGLTRYIRATITLALRKKDKEAVGDRIERKKKELRNWLTVYFSGRTLDDVRGPKNLNRICREIREAFNEQLWPKRRPLIDHVLFKEFAVQ